MNSSKQLPSTGFAQAHKEISFPSAVRIAANSEMNLLFPAKTFGSAPTIPIFRVKHRQ
jgi:hypothetical protein